jgi:type III restriction enzyme
MNERLERTRKPNKLIINSPFVEPSEHWKYNRTMGHFDRLKGRRPAGYFVASPKSKSFDDFGLFIELPLVNKIRPLVEQWRQNNYYPGATNVTRRLLEHWYDAELREGKQFFYCQLEAIETIIWLTECPTKECAAIREEIIGDGGPFERWCSKLATGTGKTVVMAMLIAWQVLNRTSGHNDGKYSKNVLIIAPGLTVKDRLEVLIPEGDGNMYDEFNVIPAGMHQQFRQGKVFIQNWHQLGWQTDEKIAKKKSVDKRGALSDEAWVRSVMGDMAFARDILVINDEAHHAWRIPADATSKDYLKGDLEDATKWVGSLDRVHKARRILRCFDFSATPFVPSGKRQAQDSLFSWVVSDFGLNDAIESGLVKTPRIVVRDEGKMGKDYKSRLYHVYGDDEVQTDLNRRADAKVPLPDFVVTAYNLLGQDWLETKRQWEKDGAPTPPVMITVANRIETAARIKNAFDKGKMRIDELQCPERTLQIDSNELKKAESVDEPVALLIDEESEDDGNEVKLTKAQHAELLRQTVRTVGQVGQPGEQIQNIISVNMLSEGWDAKTVTHIMGMRAFSSQLLCEQVIGRGLRRTNYDQDTDGLFVSQYVNVFGVPFTFLPQEESGPTGSGGGPKHSTLIQALDERKEFEISWPNVVKVNQLYTPALSLDLKKVPKIRLNAADTPLSAEMAPTLTGTPNLEMISEIQLDELAANFRLQRILFETTRDVFEQMEEDWQSRGEKEFLLGQLFKIIESFLESNRIEFHPKVFGKDSKRRRLLLTLNMNRLVHHIWSQIRFANTDKLELVLDENRPIMSTADLRSWFSSKPSEPAERSHINRCVYDSTWEAVEQRTLDKSKRVVAWAKNDHLGYEINYIFRGAPRKYRPDFLVRLANGMMLVLEVKGKKTEESDAKHAFLEEWVNAVNENGGFGQWCWDVSYEPKDVEDILAKVCSAELELSKSV